MWFFYVKFSFCACGRTCFYTSKKTWAQKIWQQIEHIRVMVHRSTFEFWQLAFLGLITDWECILLPNSSYNSGSHFNSEKFRPPLCWQHVIINYTFFIYKTLEFLTLTFLCLDCWHMTKQVLSCFFIFNLWLVKWKKCSTLIGGNWLLWPYPGATSMTSLFEKLSNVSSELTLQT